MADDPDTAEERASREATDWLILLQEMPNDEEVRERFEAWLAASSENEKAWETTARTSDLIKAIGVEEPKASTIAVVPQDRLARPKTRRSLRWAVPAAAAIAACWAVIFGPNTVLALQSDHMTGTGEIMTLDLADGTQLVLAPETAIRIDIAPDKRTVELLKGEVYFDVASNPDRPFRVDVRNVEAVVLGTAFVVRRNDTGAWVALEEGRIDVSADQVDAPVLENLVPADVVEVSWAGLVNRRTRAPEDIAAWRSGKLIAQDETIASVIDRLRPHYGGMIMINDKALGGRSITGVYSLSDPIGALGTIAETHGATATQITPWLVVISTD